MQAATPPPRSGPERDALRGAVERHLAEATGAPVELQALEPMAGGACQDNWLVLASGTAPELGDGRRLVLRSDAATFIPGSLDRARELEVVRVAVAAGVRTPAARWPATGLVRAGAGAYFLDFADGEAIGRRVVGSSKLAQARAALPEELAVELAKIHAVTPESAPALAALLGAPDDPVATLLDLVEGVLRGIPEPHPALELALRWLVENRPRGAERTLVHGDFRTGNFLVLPSGLSAILDWEFARFSTPAEDLAWITVRDWRFGKLDLPVGGFARREPFYAGYERASGRRIDRREVHWWEVLGNVRWAAGSLHQGERYLAGDRDLELIAIARRAAEMEWEAMRLIDSAGLAGGGAGGR
jgi:aminoglycoside phosphotransferase (APT) family kinase protein